MKNFFLVFVLFSLAACGFQPMYGKNKFTSVGAEEKLAQVDIGGIPDREGQYLRNALIDRFYRDSRPQNTTFSLVIQPVRESLIDLDITKTADATRGQLAMETSIKLTSKANGQTVLERTVRAVTSYNKLDSEFSTRVTEDNARINALDDLARQIELQLNLYFKRTQ